MKYGRLIGKAEAIVATGMPGLYRVIAFLVVQRIYSIDELGRAASAFSIAQILAFFTAIGWASLILVRVPAAQNQGDAVQRFYELLCMGGVSLLIVCTGVLLWVGFLQPSASGEEIVVILIGWSLYQLTRHYFLAHRAYRRVVAYDLILLAATAILVMMLHRLGVAAAWSMGAALAMVGALMLMNIGVPARRISAWKLESKGLEFGFTNFLSGGVALSLVPIARFAEGDGFAGLISLIASFSLISALIPRAISMYRLPELSRLAGTRQPLNLLTAKTGREIALACGASFLLNSGITVLIVLHKGASAHGVWYALVCGLAICAQGCISMLGMAHSNVLMVREEGRVSVAINLVSCGAFISALGVFYMATGGINFLFVLAVCLVMTLLRNVMLKRQCASFLLPYVVPAR